MIFLCRKLVGNRYFALKQYNFSQAKISNPFNGGLPYNPSVFRLLRAQNTRYGITQ